MGKMVVVVFMTLIIKGIKWKGFVQLVHWPIAGQYGRASNMSDSLGERLLANDYDEASDSVHHPRDMRSQGIKQSGIRAQGSYVSVSSHSSDTTSIKESPNVVPGQRKCVSWVDDGVDSIAENIPTTHLAEENLWGLDAAIVIHEGFLNIPLREHPASKKQIQYWKFLHHGWFPYFDLFMALVFLALAIVEKPAVPGIEVPKYGVLAVQVKYFTHMSQSIRFFHNLYLNTLSRLSAWLLNLILQEFLQCVIRVWSVLQL